MPMIATTVRSSIMLKPSCFFICPPGLIDVMVSRCIMQTQISNGDARRKSSDSRAAVVGDVSSCTTGLRRVNDSGFCLIHGHVGEGGKNDRLGARPGHDGGRRRP